MIFNIFKATSKVIYHEDDTITVKYPSVKGQAEVVEISADWAAVLVDLDRHEYNSNRRETRRHCSLEDFDMYGDFFIGDDDVECNVIINEATRELYAALDSLSPAQRKLVIDVYFNKVKQKDLAAQRGVRSAAISGQLRTALRHLKKFFESQP